MRLKFLLKLLFNLIKLLKMDMDKELIKIVQLVTTFSIQFAELMELLIKTYVNSENVPELMLLTKDLVVFQITNLITVNVLVTSILTQFVEETMLLIKPHVLLDVLELKLSIKVLVLESVDALH